LPIGVCLSPSRVIQPVCFLVIGAHRLGNRLGGNELVGEAREHAGFNRATADGAAVVAGAAPEVVGTAVAIPNHDPISATAAATFEEAREQERRAPGAIELGRPCRTHAEGGRLEELR